MKKLLLAGGVLLLATLVAVLYVWLEVREPSHAVAEQRERESAPSGAPTDAATPTPLSEPTSAPNAAANPAPAALQEEQRTEHVSPRIDPAHAGRVPGAVALPLSTPADEALELLVFEGGSDPTHLAADASEDELAGHERAIARVALAASGQFEIELPTDRPLIWVALRSRYLHGAKAVRIADGDLPARLDFAPKLGAWVTGRLLLPAGVERDAFDPAAAELTLMFDPMRFAGVAGASAALEHLRERQTHADARLEFEFRGVALGSDYDVRAVPATLAAYKSPKFVVLAGAHVEHLVELARGGMLSGRVVDHAGNAVAGAELEASIDPLVFGQGGFVVREGQTDEHGAFELQAVLAGDVELKVTSKGYLDSKLNAQVAEGRPTRLDDIVLGRGESVSGVVLWPDGSPVADLEVEADFDPAALGGMSAFNALQGAQGETHSDAQGHFEISGLGKGPFVVSAKAKPREGPGKELRARVAGVKPGTSGLELRLAPPLTLTGRVVSAAGEPLEAFEVSAQEDSGGVIPGLGGRTESERFSAANGAFVLDGLSAGKWRVDALAEGFTRSAAVEVVLPRAADAGELVLTLQRAGSVSGVVLDRNGAPAAGVDVQLKANLTEMMQAARSGARAPRNAKSDAEGKFVLRELPAGNVNLVAKAEGFAESAPVSVEVRPAEETTGVVLQMRLGGTITGEVYAENGEPIAGGQVMVQMSADPLLQRFATADAQGHFVFEHVVPGSWNVMYFALDAMQAPTSEGEGADLASMFSNMKMTSATVTEGAETHVVLGAPPANPVLVKGRVLSGTQGVPGVVITLFADGAKSMGSLKFVSSDAEGRYSVRVDEPGRFAVSVQKPGVAGQQQTVSYSLVVPEVEEYEHDFALPVGAIAGRVLGEDGQPAKGARVSLSTDGPVPNGALLGEHFAEIATDDDGRYELVWLRPGSYTVAVGGAPFAGMFGGSASSGRQLRGGVEVHEGRRTEGIDFRLRKPGRIEGVVRSSAGQPAAEAAIFLRDAQGRTLERFSMVATDGTGKFTYDGLEPGDYTVLARTDAETSAESQLVRVKEASTTDVELALGAGTVLIVTLSGDDGQPLDCSVAVLDEQGRQVNGTLSLTEVMKAFSSGAFTSKEQRVGPLPPGKYRVTVTTADGRKTTKPVNLTGQAERKLNVRL
ncbi:MAG: carboxypeptidase regulatory-like domain-containing protein [Planctomycetes bacterium]|nr:carboxypeptidase regulatory-like domain-containing protein [Planctomycetota bacterium]